MSSLSQTFHQTQTKTFFSSNSSSSTTNFHNRFRKSISLINSNLALPTMFSSSTMSLNSKPFDRTDSSSNSDSSSFDSLPSYGDEIENHHAFDLFVELGNKLADAAGDVIRQYFRKSFDILDKDDLSPVTIADKKAEEIMVSIILENFPSHAIYGEENGWMCKHDFADYVWVLDPIDGTKSFITGKPLFGTLIALLYKGKPILGIIDQPVLRERWTGVSGRRTTLNGQDVFTRSCKKLSKAYLYTTSPHWFSGDSEKAFARVRSEVKVPLYGCDCYAYALLASGHVDLVIETGLKPYDFLSLVPVIEGAGGVITDWEGNKLYWDASPDSHAPKSIKQVTKSNFAQTMVDLKTHISASDYIAVSLQKTGSFSSPWHRVLPFDTPDVAYLKAKYAACRFQPLQFAVSPFSIRASNASSAAGADVVVVVYP